ncbi:MAG TPA: sulfurtransferase [Bacteroidetes bacterium]|mgnify:FL=1|jgi:thiosulfate/3-mercaptopyruvate sulfurtransferase|nr:sulfurtransferase [Bacteroidota bacterium]
MKWSYSTFIFSLVLFACQPSEKMDNHANKPSSPCLISAEGLLSVSNQSNTVIIDFRRNKDYIKGHIEGSLNIWRTEIEDSTYSYDGLMATPSQIESLFSNLGIRLEDTLIIYDDIGLCNASRLWWILQNYDFKNVKMLEGGLSSWTKIGGELSTQIPTRTKTDFMLDKQPSMDFYVDKNDVLKAIDNGTFLLDTRTLDEFVGKEQKKGATRAGRIPNSVHIDWAESIDYNGDQCFKHLEELEEIYSKLGAKKEDPIIVYCHSGVRSAHTSFVLTQLLGYTNVRNYDGSWTEWSYIDTLPIINDITTKNK